MIDKEDVKKELEAFADSLTVIGGSYIRSAIRLAIDPMKETDAVPVIRCENCRHFDGDRFCDLINQAGWHDNDFCSYAERGKYEAD